MEALAFDFETRLMAAGYQIPHAVCMSWARITGGPGHWRIADQGVERADRGIAMLEREMRREVLFVGAETPFDALAAAANSSNKNAIRDWIHLGNANRLSDVLIRQKLMEGAVDEPFRSMKHNLGAVSERWLGWLLDKKEGWRFRFQELEGLEPSQYPQEAYDYSLKDAVATALIWIAQEAARYGIVGHDRVNYVEHFPGRDILLDESAQVRKALAIKDLASVGMMTDIRSVDLFEIQVRKEREALVVPLLEAGLLRPKLVLNAEKATTRFGKKPRATAKLKREHPDLFSVAYTQCEDIAREMITDAFTGGRLDDEEPNYTHPKTKTGIKVDKDNCERTGIPVLIKASRYKSLTKTLGADISLLRRASLEPFHAHYNTLKDNGRTATGSDKGEGTVGNVQNMPRVSGIRECWVAPPGWVFATGDYTAVELSTFGQVCLWWLGWSECARMISEGIDQHAVMGAALLNHEDPVGHGWIALVAAKNDGHRWADDARTGGKGMNFGCKAKMSAATFKLASWNNYGLKITLDESARRVRLHDEIIQEMPHYTNFLKRTFTRPGTYGFQSVFDLVHPYSGRVRAGLKFTDIHNYPFSGLAQDMAGVAIWMLFEAKYGCSDLGEADPFYGCMPCLFVHDEIVSLVPDDPERAHAAALRQAQIMTMASKRVLTHVPVETEPVLTRQLSKRAKQVWNPPPPPKDDKEAYAHWKTVRRLVPWDIWEQVKKESAKLSREELLKKGWPAYVVDNCLTRDNGYTKHT